MKYPRYPKYKDSGVEWLGDVPDGWELWKLAHAFEVIGSGTTPKSDNELYYDGNIPWVTTSELREGKITETNSNITQVALDCHPTLKIYLQGTLLIAMYGATIGRMGILATNATCNQACCALAKEVSLTTHFMFYWFQGMKPILLSFASGGGQPNLSQEIIRSITVAAPSKSEQQTIATFLDHNCAKIDALIAEQEKLIALLREKRQAVISHAVTRGLNPDTPMKDSGVEWLGAVPEGWEVSKLKFVATIQTGIAKGKDYTGKELVSVPYLRVANVQNGYLFLEDIAELEIPQEEVTRYTLIPGDVLMNEGGDFDKLGRGAIWHGEIPVCIHQNHVFAVRPHSASSEWLNLLTSSEYAQNYFISRSKQSTNLASISSSNLMELPIILPPPETQQIILTNLYAETAELDTLIAESEKAVALLKERRSALISAAVTGKIDVRNILGELT